MAGALAGAVSAGRTAWRQAYDRPGPLGVAADVVVPRGSAGDVAEALRHAGVIADPRAFRLAALLGVGGAMHAGEFHFPAGASLHQVLEILHAGRPVQHSLTIPEGSTARQIVRLLAAAPALPGPATPPPEGEVLPETYAYSYGTTPETILERGRVAMARALVGLWATRAPGLPLASPREALILASIVERETARPAERGMVAAVFLNRLRQHMRLQADSTVVYAASDGLGRLDHTLTRADLDLDSPFNTYRIAALPPAPIASPGVAALRAVLQPAASDALYFVADGTGGHVFARTLEEHHRNVARWRAATDHTPAP